MKAIFLGRSEKKFTCNAKWDYCILVEDLKEWPHSLMIKHPKTGDWRMPYNGNNWGVYAIPKSMTSMMVYFGGFEDPGQYQNFYDDSEDSFEVTVSYSDNTSEKTTTKDERQKLSTEEETTYLQDHKDWPVAVNPILIADDASEVDKLERAEGILDHFADFNLQKMKLLDFGCGEGHIVKKAIERNAIVAVGYDLEAVLSPQNSPFLITKNFNEVIAQGPYDFIIMYDVLDHAKNETPVQIMEKIKSVSKANTIIKIRCHPWISRHGGHQYKKVNKAFAHLILDEKELISSNMNFIRLNTPLQTYRDWFIGFQIKTDDIIKEPVETFFRMGMVKKRILSSQKMQLNDLNNLDCSFVDYELVLQ